MKKFTSYLTILSILILPFMMACNNDDDEEEDPEPEVQQDLFPSGVISYSYSVQLVKANSCGETSDGEAGGLIGQTVVISQGGESQTSATVLGGIAHFDSVNAGTINGYVEYDNGPNVYFTAQIDPENAVNNANQTRNVSSTITVFENNAEFRVRVFGDYNLLGVPPNLQDPTNFTRVGLNIVYDVIDYPMGSGLGRLSDVSVELNTISNETSAAGVLSLDDLPGTVPGLLEAQLYMSDFAVENTALELVLFNIHPIRNQPGTTLNLVPCGRLDLGDVQALVRID